MRSSGRYLRKSPSEGTLMLREPSKDDFNADSGMISHSKKRLAEQHDQHSRRLERASEWLRNARPPRHGVHPRHGASSTSISTTSCEDVPSAFEYSSWTSSWVDVRPSERPSESREQSCEVLRIGSEVLNDGWHDTEASSRSDRSDFERFDSLPEDRATLSRIGSQLTFTLSPSMGISQRKRLLNSLSEQVDAHEAVMLHAPIAMGSSPTQVSVNSWARSFSAGPVETGDFVQHPTQSGRKSEESVSADAEIKNCAAPAHSKQKSFLGSTSHQAAELCLRLNHARQTMSFVQAQAAKYSALDKADMSVWEALETLGDMKECSPLFLESSETDTSICILDHAYQTAEACRAAYPGEEWLHVVGLIHSLGLLLGHERIGGEPQWAIYGESFPVGCRFDPHIEYQHYFSVNPDRRRRQFSSPHGIYRPGVGLVSVYMSWSASEYLYMLLLLNKTKLPPEALFVIRYQKFLALEASKTYKSLMSKTEKAHLPWLERFRSLSAYKKLDIPQRLTGEALRQHYTQLLEKYIPDGVLQF